MEENLLIVGKNSYIGRYLTEYAIALGVDTISLSSKDCDFLKADEVSSFFNSLGSRCYTVVFLAIVNKSVANSFQSFIHNIEMVKNLIGSHKFANIESIIYFGSVDVYGRKPVLPITEQSKIDPDSWYGLAKYACEWMFTSSGEVDCPVTILRLPGIYGCSHNDKSVIGRMVSSIRNEQRVIIRGSGRVLRDYVYINDLCRLLQLLIPLRHHGVLNVATGESRSILEIAKLIGSVLRAEFDIVHEAVDEERDFDLAFDIHTLASLVPAFRFSSMAAGIRSYL
jgi:UDP-glucose 4-epimerase